MSQNIELAKVKAKIRALIAKSTNNGASENEAMVAMKKVGELLQQFNLSMTDVSEVRKEACIEGTYNTGSKHVGVETSVAVAIGKMTGTRVWMVRGTKEIVLHYFGLETDVEMAIYLTDIIANSYDTEFDLFKQTSTYINFTGHRRVVQTNFQKGFKNRIYSRIMEQVNEQKYSVFNTTGTDLVVVEKEKYVEEEFAKMGMKLRTTKTYNRSRFHSGAYSSGINAGDKVNLNRPITSSSNFGGYIS